MKIQQRPSPVVPIASIDDLLDEAVRTVPDRAAYRFKKGNEICDITYREFKHQVFSLGTGLCKLGIDKEHIGILAENRYEWICCYFSVLRSRNVVVPIDKELPIGDMTNVLNNSGTSVLFYSAKYEERVREMADQLPNIRLYIGLDSAEDSEDGKFLSYAKVMERGEFAYQSGDTSYVDQKVNPYEMTMLVYTSGTTGLAKGVMLSEHNLVSSIYYGMHVSLIYDVGLSILPYNHTYEAVCDLFAAMHHHTTLCINDSLRNVAKNLELFHPKYMYVVPAFIELFYKKIWANAKKTGKDAQLRKMIKISNTLRKVGIDLRRKLFASIHKVFGGQMIKIICGGAPVRPELCEFFDAIGILITNGYGITECSPLVSVNQNDTNECSTVGIPLPCLEVRIDHPDENGIGEICVKGDVVMLGYYKMPEQTKEVLSEDGWFRTGDYGKMTENGKLMLSGRKKNLIILSNGKNIFPEELENIIEGLDYVTEVVVYGHENENGQEDALYAEIYCKDETVSPELEARLKKDIAELCRELPSYKHIARVFVRACEFEKTTTQKIRRNTVVKR